MFTIPRFFFFKHSTTDVQKTVQNFWYLLDTLRSSAQGESWKVKHARWTGLYVTGDTNLFDKSIKATA